MAISIREKNKQIKRLKRNIKIISIINSIALLLCLFLIIYLFNNSHIQYRFKDLTINYTNLNETEIELVNNILNKIKPIYLTVPSSITFTRNLTEFYNNPFQSSKTEAEEMKNTLGFNQWDNIYILYEHNELYLRHVLCHELLHSYLRLSEKSHDVVYDLSRYQPCYEVTKI